MVKENLVARVQGFDLQLGSEINHAARPALINDRPGVRLRRPAGR